MNAVPEAHGPAVFAGMAAVDFQRNPEELGNRDTSRGPADPIVQPAVLRPHSSQRNDRRPLSRLKRSSCPTIRQRNRVARRPSVTWQSTEPTLAIMRSVDVVALAQIVGHLQRIGPAGSPCHASTAAIQSSRSTTAFTSRAPVISTVARGGRGRTRACHRPGRRTLRSVNDGLYPGCPWTTQ